jgi:hypothetical protein
MCRSRPRVSARTAGCTTGTSPRLHASATSTAHRETSSSSIRVVAPEMCVKQSTGAASGEDLQEDLGEVDPWHHPRDLAAHDLELRRIRSRAEPLQPQPALLDDPRVPRQFAGDLPVRIIERDRQRPQLHFGI